LPHVHNAANMRRQAEAKGEESDISSDEDEQMFDSDDIDSDEAEEFFKAEDGDGETDFAEQKDFVAMWSTHGQRSSLHGFFFFLVDC